MNTDKTSIENEQDIKTRTSVFQIFKSGDEISVSLIQRKCQVGYNSASRTFENLVEDGLIELIKGTYGKML